MRTSTLLLVFFTFSTYLSAQNFVPAMDRYSHKKTAYVHMDDGSLVKGTIKDVDRKKGLVKMIKIKDANDSKTKIKPEAISHMYLPPNGFEKLGSLMNNAFDINKWETVDLDKDILSKGYVYLEKTEVRIKKKTHTLMLQVINPTFNSAFVVYEDPLANETTSVGIGGLTLAGGVPKEVFIRKTGETVAFHYHKKRYDEEFKNLYGDCKEVMDKYGDNPKWDDLEKHLWDYTQCKK